MIFILTYFIYVIFIFGTFFQKSSKKVSIAENLNCDYSDISSLYNETEENLENNEDNKQLENNSSDCDRLNLLVIKSMVKEVICNLLIFLLLAVLKILNIVSTKPFQCFGILLVLYLFSCIFNYKQDPYQQKQNNKGREKCHEVLRFMFVHFFIR